ncbi:MAG: hypothetical protein M1821_008156 [Bathelium mastoideum]|nr:MAG: hypothetical protein M1821_008156 [Bathelium mastoideum]
MPPAIEKVIVIGGGGNTGPYIVEALQTAGFEVAILSRTSSETIFPEKITVHKTDYDMTSLVKIFQGYDAVVSVVATFSTDQQNIIIDAAVHAGVKRFLPSEYGIDTSLPQLAEYVSFAKGKQDTVAYLKTKEGTQLSWSALCVGAFFDWVLKIGGGLMGWDIPARRATVFDSGDQPYEATNMRQIGRAVAGILKHPEGTKNRYVYVNSFTVTQNQVITAVEKASGDKFEVSKMTTRDLRDEGYRNAEKGNLELGFPQVVTSAIYGHGGLNNFSAHKELANETLGLPKESLEETIAEVLEEMRSRP